MEITYISLDMLKESCSHNSYADDYLFITNNLDNIFLGNQSVKLEVFIMIYCAEGSINIELNNSIRHLGNNDILSSLPNTIIRRINESTDSKIKVFCFSSRFIRKLFQTDKDTWKSIRFLQQNPIKHFTEEEMTLFNQYLNLIEIKVNSNIDKYQKEILLYIASAFFGEFIADTKKTTEKYSYSFEDIIKQPDFIFKQFMETLSRDNGRHRTLDYYADILGYSSKYLSRIIKKISRKNALKIINKNTIEHIITELKFSNKSIKEIAIDFEFSNISFFSQYVKKHLGMTPIEFRSNNRIKQQ